jgi:hypothetical protein
MLAKNHLLILLTLLSAICLPALSGCGQASASQTRAASAAGNTPDSVRIEIDPIEKQTHPVVTLTAAALVRQFYLTTSTLPLMPAQRICTAEMSTRYTLTFLHGKKTLATADAQRYGCRPVSIAGEKQARQATPMFWSQLDQAIFKATPAASAQRLALLQSPSSGQSLKIALISSATTAQQFYDAALALPLVAREKSCPADDNPEYQLAIHTKDQAIPVSIDPNCNHISLRGGYQYRGGVHSMNTQFKHLLATIQAGATFAPVHPDHLIFAVIDRKGRNEQKSITDPVLLQQFYAKSTSLQPVPPQQDCPSGADKMTGKGTFYNLDFSQWSLPLLSLEVYEGSCRWISSSPSSPFTEDNWQGDQQFWDLIHHVASQH